MPLIIDAYNVLHVVGVLPPHLAGIDLAGLVALIRRSRYRREPIDVVCDGTPHGRGPAGQMGSITIHYAGKGRPADDLIVELIDAAADSRRLTVVTSDSAVLRAARRRRCRTATAQRFLEHLVSDAESGSQQTPSRPSGPLPQEQVDHWIDRFGLDETDLAAGSAKGRVAKPSPAPKEPKPSKSPTKRRAASPAPGSRDSAANLPQHVIREAEALLTETEQVREPAAGDQQPSEQDCDQVS